MSYLKQDDLISIGYDDVIMDKGFLKNHWEIRKILRDILDILRGRKGMLVYDKH